MKYPTITEINVDLDGVLVNFIGTAVQIAGLRPDDDHSNKQVRRDFWKKIEMHVRKGGKFFEIMEPLEDAFQLWNYLDGYPRVICSATGHTVGAAEEKRNWVRRHLGHEAANHARLVRDAVNKSKYAGPGIILIDDRRKAIDPWIAAGGIGILHVNATDTIAQLKEYGI